MTKLSKRKVAILLVYYWLIEHFKDVIDQLPQSYQDYGYDVLSFYLQNIDIVLSKLKIQGNIKGLHFNTAILPEQRTARIDLVVHCLA